MTDLRYILLSVDATIREAIERLDHSGLQIAVVVDDGILQGTITDGDVRRGIMRGLDLTSSVRAIMNNRPQTVHQSEGPHVALQRMRARRIHQLPVVDDDGRVVDLLLLDDLLTAEDQEALVVLMAGGYGKRLRPLTVETPKPLLPVGGKPLIETIVESFVTQGFRHIYLSVNYKAEQFYQHFGDGQQFGAQISYVHEPEPLGTAGALSLLPNRPDVPVVVMNGDLLTSVNFASMLRFHTESDAIATMCVREHTIHIPYGVVDTDGQHVTQIVEKPNKTVFVSAGIYVLSPQALDHIPAGHYYDMPTLFTDLIEGGKPVGAFPIREYWLDIGQREDLEQARREYHDIFC